jgi:hypothetical protein
MWAAATAAVLVTAGAVAILQAGDSGTRVVAVANPLPIPPLPVPVPPVPAAPRPAVCTTTATGPFTPTRVALPGIVHRVPILPLHRDANGTPGVPPISEAGKTEMAFDLGNGIKPGSPAGNALLNAHTWPDGSALGNRLLAELHKGDPIVVRGEAGRQCYKVTDRVEVSEYDAGKRYFDTKGHPQIALVVCSGRRLGPGHWTMRTIWYAAPVKTVELTAPQAPAIALP